VGNGDTPVGKVFEPYLGTTHSFFVSSGRGALWLILKALSKMAPDRREVVIPAYTCPAVASAVLKAGLKPVLCDINLTGFGFSLEQLDARVGRNTLATVVVHLFGYPANVRDVLSLCKSRGAFVIEDAAQAFGNSTLESETHKLGLLADAGFFSFGRGKPLTAVHGGLVVTPSQEISRGISRVYETLHSPGRAETAAYLLRLGVYSLFYNPSLYWLPERLPFLGLGETVFEPDIDVSKGHAAAALVLYDQLDSIEEDKRTRAENAAWYASSLSGFTKPPGTPGFPFSRYPAIFESKAHRDRVLNALLSAHTGAALFYPTPLNELPGLREVLGDETVYTNARRLADTLITLPVQRHVTAAAKARIASAARVAFSRCTNEEPSRKHENPESSKCLCLREITSTPRPSRFNLGRRMCRTHTSEKL
jgi:dTDP-4-amino-4,6-dideoxygalactose transaminase